MKHKQRKDSESLQRLHLLIYKEYLIYKTMRKPKTEIHFDTEDLNKIEYLKSIYNIKTRSGLVKHLINIHYDSHRYIAQEITHKGVENLQIKQKSI